MTGRRALLYSVMIATLLLLSSCESRGDAANGGVKSGCEKTTPASILGELALYATWAAGVLFFLAILAAIFLPAFRLRAIQAAIASVFIIAGAQIMFWFGEHMWILVCGIVVAGIALAIVMRKKIEAWIGVDLDRDGHIGEVRDETN